VGLTSVGDLLDERSSGSKRRGGTVLSTVEPEDNGNDGVEDHGEDLAAEHGSTATQDNEESVSIR
jgi:hypothetical protein